MQQLVPNFGPGFTTITLAAFFKKQRTYISFLAESTGDDLQNPKIVEVDNGLSERSAIEPSQWEIVTIKNMKNKDGKTFTGACFYNKEALPLTWKDADKAIDLFGFAIYADSSCNSSEFGIYGTFSKKIELKAPVPKALSIPANMLIGYFGKGDFTPTLEEIMQQEKENEETGCPLVKPKNCKYKDNEKFCAFVKEDNICLKTVSLKVTAHAGSGGAA